MLGGDHQERGIPLFFVEGNADLITTKLIGHTNPARVLRENILNATGGALSAGLRQDALGVIAFWSDAVVLLDLGQPIKPRELLDTMLRMPARGTHERHLPARAGGGATVRVPARDAGRAARYFSSRESTRSASGLPPVWQVGQYWNSESA